jgi:hypothetical protein
MKRIKSLINWFRKTTRFLKRSERIPSKWSQITLEQFIQLKDLPETDNDVTNLINQLSVLTTLDPEEIREMNGRQIVKINKKLDFLKELPKVREVRSFRFKGKRYQRDEVEGSTVAQITDILQMNQNENNVGAKILNAIAVIYYRDGESEYNADRFKQMKDELLTVPFPIALSSTVFFSRGLTRFFPDALRDFLNKLTIRETERLTLEIGNDFDLKDFGRFINGTTLRSDSEGETLSDTKELHE